MAIELKKIGFILNRIITYINIILFGIIGIIGLTTTVNPKKFKEKNIPVYLNIALLLVLAFFAFSFIYTIYLDQQSR